MPSRKKDNIINQYVIAERECQSEVEEEGRRIRKRAHRGGNAI